MKYTIFCAIRWWVFLNRLNKEYFIKTFAELDRIKHSVNIIKNINMLTENYNQATIKNILMCKLKDNEFRGVEIERWTKNN